ncbi:MAG TPA: hypothetical protein VJH33_00840 [Candidatus Paceibacterota bacterium]
MTGEKIIVAVGDAGAWQYFKPIFQQLRDHYDVELLADINGAAIVELMRENVSHRATDGRYLLERDGLHGVSAILCGTAGKVFDLWRNATDASIGRVPCAWFGDFYGSGCEAQVRGVTPDYLFTFDDTTAERFLKIVPHLRTRTHVVGNPAFDAIADARLRLHRMREEARIMLDVVWSNPLVVYSASSAGQFDLEESLRALVQWVKAYTPTFPWTQSSVMKFAVRFHPADVKNKPEDVARLQRCVYEELGQERVVDLKDMKGLELASVADLLVTDYSTEVVKACLLGVPTAFVMLKSAQKYLRDAKGGEFPFLSILEEKPDSPAPALGVYAPDDMRQLNRVLSGAWTLRARGALEHPRFSVLCDGEAGNRVLAGIKRVVESGLDLE